MNNITGSLRLAWYPIKKTSRYKIDPLDEDTNKATTSVPLDQDWV